MATEEIRCDSALEMFKEDFNEQPEFVKKNMLTRLRDFFQPSKTRIKEPAIQKNTRRRPSLKKQQKNELMLQVNHVKICWIGSNGIEPGTSKT